MIVISRNCQRAVSFNLKIILRRYTRFFILRSISLRVGKIILGILSKRYIRFIGVLNIDSGSVGVGKTHTRKTQLDLVLGIDYNLTVLKRSRNLKISALGHGYNTVLRFYAVALNLHTVKVDFSCVILPVVLRLVRFIRNYDFLGVAVPFGFETEKLAYRSYGNQSSAVLDNGRNVKAVNFIIFLHVGGADCHFNRL